MSNAVVNNTLLHDTNEGLYEAIIQGMDQGFCLIEVMFDKADKPVDYRFLQVNPAFSTLSGLRDAVGKTIRELVPTIEAFWIETYGEVALSGEPVRFEHYSEALNAFFDVFAKRVGGATSRKVAIVFNNITERKRAEATLRESEEKYRTLTELSVYLVWMLNSKGELVYLNQTYQDYFGIPQEELRSQAAWRRIVHPEDYDSVIAKLNETFATQTPFSSEHRLLGRDGKYRWFLHEGYPLRGAAGEVKHFLGVAVDIDDRKRAEEALKEADRRKDEYLAVLAHELRNPLAPIRMSLEVMRLTKDETAQQEARNLIERQVEQMVHLVDDLLDVSRITRGAISLRKEQLKLKEVLALAVEAARAQLLAKEHELVVCLLEEDLELVGDKTRLVQVFLNLLTNAAKYTEPRGKISLVGERQGRNLVVRVRDNGLGIASEMLPHIFEMFVQVDKGIGTRQEGLGIGLNLVKRLAELHGGHVEAHSAGLGQGSEFIVYLPASKSSTQLVAKPKEVQATAARPRRVLVVDDYEANVRTLSSMLRLMGHEVSTAQRGGEALERLQTFSPDFILLDINMPDMSGYEVVRHLKQNAAYQGVILVALTGYGAEEDVRRIKEAGFHHHLLKPISLEILENLLRGDEAQGNT
jgi:PAS domain S-box-containing protein